MTVYLLNPHDYAFPDPSLAGHEGLIAVGGDLCPARLLSAYSLGIYPCYGPDNPIMWWSPESRPVIMPALIHIPSRLKRFLRNVEWRMSIDLDFEAVIQACASSIRKQHGGIWLLPEVIAAYTELHRLGLAHSVEVWDRRNDLIGGLYGVSLGRAFFGESMFHRQANASKAALLHLSAVLSKWDFHFIDCQQSSKHIAALGAVSISRDDFMRRLDTALSFPTCYGQWKDTASQAHGEV